MRKSVVISISLISAILAFTGKDAYIITRLSDSGLVSKDKIGALMNLAFFASIIFPLIIAPAQLISQQKKNERLENILIKQFKQLKNSLTVTFREVLQQPHATFNIRIFVPLKGRKKLISRTIKKEKYFIIRNIEGLADNHIKELCFKVLPEPFQGLVGLTYKLKDITYDPSPNKPADKPKRHYHLDNYQITKTANVGFITAAPIFNPDNRITAIVTVDSEINVGALMNDEQEEKLKKIFQQYCDNYLSEVLSLLK